MSICWFYSPDEILKNAPPRLFFDTSGAEPEKKDGRS